MKEKYTKLINQIINKSLKKKHKVYLFGSRARRDHDESSDIDIALELIDSDNCKIDQLVLAEIRENLSESHLPYFVDVLDINNIDEEMKVSLEKESIDITMQNA